MFQKIRYDLEAFQARDPAARSKLEIFLLYSGFHAVFWYRIAHWFYQHHCFFIARLLSQSTKFFTGIEIHPGATIGKGLMIDHGSGVVIGETTIIGDDCTLYQGVTLGGTGKDVGKRHPTLGNNVMIGSGAKVLGPLLIGDNSKVASNAVVLKSIPPNCTAVGVPARVVRQDGKKVVNNTELDHVHIPDPVAHELRRMERKIKHLEKKLAQLQEEKEQSADE